MMATAAVTVTGGGVRGRKCGGGGVNCSGCFGHKKILQE